MFRLSPLPLWLLTDRHRRRLMGYIARAEKAFDDALEAANAVRQRQEKIIDLQAAVIRQQRVLLAQRDERLAIVDARAEESNQLVGELTARLEHLGGRP